MTRPSITVVDLFAGAGGTSTGVLQAAARLGLNVNLVAINHWQIAIATHKANHIDQQHLCAKVEEVNPLKVVPSGRLRLLVASPECVHHSRARGGKPRNDQSRTSAWHVLRWMSTLYVDQVLIENVPEFCFPDETAVLSKRGLVPIGELRVGDEVWTHNARWKPVTAISRRTATTVRVKGYGNSIIETTPNHEFYSRQIAPRITVSGKNGRHELRLLEPEWIRADQLADYDPASAYTKKYSGYTWATPCDLPRYWMRMPDTLGVDTTVPAFFYMIGRWLGDGWIRHRKNRQDLVRICANKAEANELQEHLANTGLTWHRQSHGDSVDLFDLSAASSRILIRWLVFNFGEYAHRKTLPAWIYGASQEQRWALIEGYCDSDGHEKQNGQVSMCSVSRCLAVGMRLLLQSLGVQASISRVDAHISPSISAPEGEINCRESFSVSWQRDTEWEKCFRTELHIWGRVREVEPCREEVEVWDITVSDDHSFIADGQVVHNCNWGPLGADGLPLKSKKGETFHAFLEAIRSLGYAVEYRVLNCADYGAPQTRERLFIQAVRGRRKIVWPEPTHSRDGAPTLFGAPKPWRTAREIVDWSIPGQSIFTRKKPLVPNTLKRIFAGLEKFCEISFARVASRGADSPIEPFLVQMEHSGNKGIRSIQRPMPAITSADAFGVCEPFLVKFYGGHDACSLDAPLPSVTANYEHYGLAQPFLLKYNVTGGGARAVDDPVYTITVVDRFGLVEIEITLSGKLQTIAGIPIVFKDGARGILDLRFRMLTQRELARAQSFPDSYQFLGTRKNQTQQIGNAVPPVIAEHLALAMLTE